MKDIIGIWVMILKWDKIWDYNGNSRSRVVVPKSLSPPPHTKNIDFFSLSRSPFTKFSKKFPFFPFFTVGVMSIFSKPPKIFRIVSHYVYDLFWVDNLIRPRAVTNLIFFSYKNPLSFMRAQHFPSYYVV